jgi:hypothetical protein
VIKKRLQPHHYISCLASSFKSVDLTSFENKDRTVEGIYAIKGKVSKASDLDKLSLDNGIYLVDAFGEYHYISVPVEFIPSDIQLHEAWEYIRTILPKF